MPRRATSGGPRRSGGASRPGAPRGPTRQVEAPTLILYGPDDRIVPKDFPKRCKIAFRNRVGPLLVPECGHFLQWERADVLNEVAKLFFAGMR